MRIAYFVQLNTLPGAGVNKKVAGQIRQWLALGHNVKLFLGTKDPKLVIDFTFDSENYEVEVVKFGTIRLPPPLDGRLAALSSLVDSVYLWEPDIVYTRQELYLPPLGRLLSRQRVVVEINTNDLEEIRNSNPIFQWYYRRTRDMLLRRAIGHIFVSGEISDQPHYQFIGMPTKILGNGIDLGRITPGRGDNQTLSLVFIGSPRQEWHGVDKIAQLALLMPEWVFHVIGVDYQDLKMVCPPNVLLHGHLDSTEYAPIMQNAVAAFGTLALHRKAMNEASPLKVREYLGYGLPVILGYKDTDFPEESEYILTLPNVERNVELGLDAIKLFAERWRGHRVSRSDIAFLDYSEKERIRLDFFSDLLSSVPSTANRRHK